MTAKTAIERQARLRGLYAITPEMDDLAKLEEMLRAALDGGTRLVQYRAKRLSTQERMRQGQAILFLCRERGVPFIVNDDLELAICLGADGVHLGRDDGDPREARRRMPDGILGVSCYNDLRLTLSAAEAGADYAGFGSIFASHTKPNAIRVGLAALKQAKRLSPIPIAAIGGVTPERAADVVSAGADMIAVLSGLFDASDVTAAAKALSRPFDQEGNHHA